MSMKLISSHSFVSIFRINKWMILKSVNFQLIGFDQFRLCKPTTNVVSLITLQLKNFSVLGMLNYCSIASELLLARTDNFFQVIFTRESLNCSQCFSTISLLDTDMY